MTARAWLIGIENYPHADGLVSRHLEGTHDATVAMYRWLTEVRHVDPASIWLNTDMANFPGEPAGLRGGAADELRETLGALVTAGAGSTETLVVWYSGHGFVLTDRGNPGARADILVGADFLNLAASGNECLNLKELQNTLTASLGSGSHFYFVDACRNLTRREAVEVGAWGKRFKPVAAQPAVFVMNSTRPGAAAGTASGFASHLTSGLAGAGSAKRWEGDVLGVYFDSLLRYVAAKVTGQDVYQDVESRAATGLLHVVEPVPTYHLTVRVVGAASDDTFEATLIGTRTVVREAFTGDRFPFTGIPDQYGVVVEEDHQMLRSIGRPYVALFDDGMEITYVRPNRGEVIGAVTSPAPDARVSVHYGGHESVKVDLLHLADSTITTTVGSQIVGVPVGSYRVMAFDGNGHAPIASRDIDLGSVLGGAPIDLLDVVGWTPSPARDSCAALLPIERRGRSWVELAGQIADPLVDGDPRVWLALIGASRILDVPASDSVDLDLFADHAREAPSPVFIIVGLESGDTARVRLWPDEASTVTIPAGDSLLSSAVLGAEPGPKLLTIDVRGVPPKTIVTHGFADRATLITVSGNPEQPVIGQFSLPIAGRYDRLDPDVSSSLADISHRGALNWVRWAAQAQRSFARRAALSGESASDEFWQMLLYGKWLDPIMSILAGYELVRAGDTRLLESAIDNLRKYFGGLTDVDYLAYVISDADAPPAVDHPPLVLEGALGLQTTSPADLPASHLDQAGPWTAWIGAEPQRRPGGDA